MVVLEGRLFLMSKVPLYISHRSVSAQERVPCGADLEAVARNGKNELTGLGVNRLWRTHLMNTLREIRAGYHADSAWKSGG